MTLVGPTHRPHPEFPHRPRCSLRMTVSNDGSGHDFACELPSRRRAIRKARTPLRTGMTSALIKPQKQDYRCGSDEIDGFDFTSASARGPRLPAVRGFCGETTRMQRFINRRPAFNESHRSFCSRNCIGFCPGRHSQGDDRESGSKHDPVAHLISPCSEPRTHGNSVTKEDYPCLLRQSVTAVTKMFARANQENPRPSRDHQPAAPTIHERNAAILALSAACRACRTQ